MPKPDVAEARGAPSRYRVPRHACKLAPVTSLPGAVKSAGVVTQSGL